MVGKWGKVSSRGRAQITSHEPLLSLHHFRHSLCLDFSISGKISGLLWQRFIPGNGHSFSGQLPPLPHVTFHLLLGVLIAEKFTASHHWFECVHQLFFFFCHLQKPLKTWSLYLIPVKTPQLLKYWNILQFIFYVSNSWQTSGQLKKPGLTLKPKWGYESINWNHKETEIKGNGWYEHPAAAVWS